MDKDYFSKKFELNDSHLINIKFKGLSCPDWDKNNKEHLTYLISITNKKLKKTISFNFYDSEHETEIYNKIKNFSPFNKVFVGVGCLRTELKNKDIVKWKKEKPKEILYNVLCSIALDYNDDYKDEYDFFDTFGYDATRQNKRLYYRVLEQAEKLQSVFCEDDLKLFDENDNILKNTIEKNIKEVV